MTVLPLDSIVVKTNRQRQAHDEEALQELIGSILESSLLHPPVVRREGDRIVLVAGERRLRACREITELGGTISYAGQACAPGFIPTTDIGELDALAAEEAELQENLRREDLSWLEQVAAEARLVSLRRTQAEIAGTPPPRTLAIAKELRGPDATPNHAQAVAQSVILARNLHRPEVKAAGSVKEAMKALKRVEESERNAAIAAKLGGEFLGAQHSLIQGDCIEWMRGQGPNQFDVVCTDPPYGMGADEFGDSGGGAAGAHFYEDSYGSWLKLAAVLPAELFRLAKPDAHCYLFCDFDRFAELKLRMTAEGWKVFRTPLIWFKPSAFRAPWPQQGPQRKYECVLYAVKGNLLCTTLAGDVLQYPPDDNLGHQAQKPVALFLDLLKRSVRPGMRVLDPFCGSGPIFPAAHGLSAIATGVEQDANAFGIAATRIKALGGVK